jgi:hypothetical protein
VEVFRYGQAVAMHASTVCTGFFCPEYRFHEPAAPACVYNNANKHQSMIKVKAKLILFGEKKIRRTLASTVNDALFTDFSIRNR